MKTFLTILFFTSSLTLIAKEKILQRPDAYTIKSDTLSNDLQPGEVRVKGQVLEPYKAGNPIEAAMIATIDGLISTYTDAYGNYELIIRDSDTSLYMYRYGFQEIAIDHYDFQAGHTVEIIFRPPTENVKRTPVNTGGSGYESLKPVIYLYSDAPLEVSLTLDYLGDLTFTYPEYNAGWNVTVDQNGISDPLTERSYPYLFWEGEMDGLVYEKEAGNVSGQVIATDTLVAFLEHQLTAIGLNRQEQTDFITFWAPKMANSEYVFVQFLLDDLYASKVAELTINPAPEALKRVYLLYTPFQEIPNIEFSPQAFKPFKRAGFTVIEWGGSEIKLNPFRL
ncbi:MAG: hypothetical protein GQ574_25105 [Crocinitomix sp.]|nr:hypothetical protein [Crocinitomix sp.]